MNFGKFKKKNQILIVTNEVLKVLHSVKTLLNCNLDLKQNIKKKRKEKKYPNRIFRN